MNSKDERTSVWYYTAGANEYKIAKLEPWLSGTEMVT